MPVLECRGQRYGLFREFRWGGVAFFLIGEEVFLMVLALVALLETLIRTRIGTLIRTLIFSEHGILELHGRALTLEWFCLGH